MDGERNRPLAGRHQPIRLAKEPAPTSWPVTSGTDLPPQVEIVFGRQGRLGMRTIRITAIGENRSHHRVSTVSRVSDNDHGAAQSILGPDWNRRFNCETVRTVLTQTPAFVSGNRTYVRPD